jgi:hypothetical protein
VPIEIFTLAFILVVSIIETIIIRYIVKKTKEQMEEVIAYIEKK